jgi:hypothetical protein
MNQNLVARLNEQVAPVRKALTEHSIYGHIESIEDLRIFMEGHIYAVWDFMSLLKALQRGITCVEVPWFPTRHVASRRLINEIVLGEESDLDQKMNPISHYELYLDAMVDCGADTSTINRFLAHLQNGRPLAEALRLAESPPYAAEFVRATWEILSSEKLHVIAAAFTFGREEVIPDMFRAFIGRLDGNLGGRLERFKFYLERHIEVDEESHTPLALQMVQDLCCSNQERWQEVADASVQALEARISLWNGIKKAIQVRRRVVA